jgi:hypothetical protein
MKQMAFYNLKLIVGSVAKKIQNRSKFQLTKASIMIYLAIKKIACT